MRRLGCLLLIGAAACGPTPAPEPAPAPTLETVEVGAARDATASLAGEPVERRRAEAPAGVAGVLPDGFPADVPLYRPSSLIDFGSEPGGRIAIVLATADSPSRVAATYPGLLAASGWQSLGGERWSKGGRELTVSWSDARPGSRLRLATTPR